MSSGAGGGVRGRCGHLGGRDACRGVGLTGVTSLAVTSGRSSAVGTGSGVPQGGRVPALITSSSGEVMVPVSASRRLISSRMNAALTVEAGSAVAAVAQQATAILSSRS